MPPGARATAVVAVLLAHVLLVGALLRPARPVPSTSIAAIEATLIDETPVAPVRSPSPPAVRPTEPERRAVARPTPVPRTPRPPAEAAVIARPPTTTTSADPDPVPMPVPRPTEPPHAESIDPASAPRVPPPPPDPPSQLAAAPAPVPAAPKTVAIAAVQYLQPPVLDYPLAARRAREEGRVHVRVLVDPRGLPAQAMVVRSSGHQRLDASALSAAQATRFRPYTENGVALPFWVVMPLIFELEN